MQYIKTAGLMIIYTCIFFILYSKDFYRENTFIVGSIFYFPLGCILIVIIMLIIMKVKDIKGEKIILYIIISLAIFISITQGVRGMVDRVARDVIKQYYGYFGYDYKSLLSLPEYIGSRGNLFTVKLDIYKEGIFVEKLYEGNSDIEDHGVKYVGKVQNIKERIYLDYKSGYYFIYDWDERKLVDKILKSQLSEQVIRRFKVSKEQIEFIQETALEVAYDDNNIQRYYIVPRAGRIILVNQDTNEKVELN